MWNEAFVDTLVKLCAGKEPKTDVGRKLKPDDWLGRGVRKTQNKVVDALTDAAASQVHDVAMDRLGGVAEALKRPKRPRFNVPYGGMAAAAIPLAIAGGAWHVGRKNETANRYPGLS